MLLSLFVGQKLGTLVSRENHDVMIVLKELIEEGKVTPVIDRTYPLSEAAKAIHYLEEGHAQGRAVINIRGVSRHVLSSSTPGDKPDRSRGRPMLEPRRRTQ